MKHPWFIWRSKLDTPIIGQVVPQARVWPIASEYPLVNIQKAIENGHRHSGFSQLEHGDFPVCYVKLPEGTWYYCMINGHATGTNLLEVPIPYIFGLFFYGYVREYPHKIWPEKWYSTSILWSWNSHWYYYTTRILIIVIPISNLTWKYPAS